MHLYCPTREEVLHTAAEEGAGGEGRVFSILGHPGLLAKVYKEPGAAQRREKVGCLIVHPLHDLEADGHHRFASPQAILLDPATHAFIGYLMPRLPPTSAPLHEYSDPAGKRYRREKAALRVALAAAVAELVADAHRHELMIVIGDLNPSNVLADDFARAALIDLDSCQLTTPHGETYYCPVHTGEYAAPELYGKDLRRLRRDPASDLFALAILIWQLIMEGGRHPFAAADEPDLNSRIRRGDFAYVAGSAHRPPPGAPPLAALPAELQQLFIRAFVDGHWQPEARPAAALWAEAVRRNAKALLGPAVVPVAAPAAAVTPAPARAPARRRAARRRRRAAVLAGAVAVVTAVVLSLLPAGRLGRLGLTRLAGLTPAVSAAGRVLPRRPGPCAETPAYWRRLRDGAAEPLIFEIPIDTETPREP